jgi:hypothetical protein
MLGMPVKEFPIVSAVAISVEKTSTGLYYVLFGFS